MKSLTKKLATALIGLGALSGTITEANACPGGGGGGGRSFGGYHRPAYHPQPRYVQPAPQPYYQQAYSQPSYNQPLDSYGDPSFGQPGPQFAGHQNPGLNPNGLPPTVRKMASIRTSGGVNPQFQQGGQFNGQQPGGQQFAQQPGGQQLGGQQFNGQPQLGQPNGGQPRLSQGASRTDGQPARQSDGGQASLNALQALGGSPMQNQPQGGQQFAQSQGGQNQAAPPQQTMARRPQSQAAPQQQQSQQQQSSPMAEAQLSALQALGGFESEQPQQLDAQNEQPEQAQSFEEEAQPVQAARSNSGRPANQQTHVGNWTASLQNGSKVVLTLQPNGNFSWVATSGEKVSSFEGNYTVSSGSLTLIRSSDNQKLIGAMTPSGSSSFTFKLTGTKDAGLNFSRS